MNVTRREFGKLAMAAVPTALVADRALAGASVLQSRPSSLFNGVQVGVITYSYRAMPEQGADAMLRYVLDSGISAVELMGSAIEAYAGAPAMPRPPAGGPGAGGPGGRRQPTPEEVAAREKHAAALKAWRLSQSMDKFKALRRLYDDAGVKIYATKLLTTSMTDEELEYVFDVSEALGANHTTLELLTDDAQLKRVGDYAMKKKIYAAYHTHAQGNMTAFDKAFALSNGNKANVDFGHWVAAGNVGGTPMDFLQKHHSRISSFHLKDRTTPDHCSLNLAWGTGETPIMEILQMVKKNKWDIPASIELEYTVPEGSDAVKEVRKCVEYCRTALTART